MTKTHTRSQSRRQDQRHVRREDSGSNLLGLTARVRRAELTPLGHVSIVLDTPAGRLKALSDAAGVHLPQLQPGTQVQVILLRLRRATPDAVRHWQLLCVRPLAEPTTTALKTERSRA